MHKLPLGLSNQCCRGLNVLPISRRLEVSKQESTIHLLLVNINGFRFSSPQQLNSDLTALYRRQVLDSRPPSGTTGPLPKSTVAVYDPQVFQLVTTLRHQPASQEVCFSSSRPASDPLRFHPIPPSIQHRRGHHLLCLNPSCFPLETLGLQPPRPLKPHRQMRLWQLQS